MIELDLEQIIFKPVDTAPPSRQIMQRILLNSRPLGPFLSCFYLIAHPKGTIEVIKLDLEQIVLKPIVFRHFPSRQIMHEILLN